jgi:hypothetical protein
MAGTITLAITQAFTARRAMKIPNIGLIIKNI